MIKKYNIFIIKKTLIGVLFTILLSNPSGLFAQTTVEYYVTQSFDDSEVVSVPPTEETTKNTNLELPPEDAKAGSEITNSTVSNELVPAASESLETSPETASKELVLINGNVTEHQQLLTDIELSDDTNRSIEVVVLDDEKEGLRQV